MAWGTVDAPDTERPDRPEFYGGGSASRPKSFAGRENPAPRQDLGGAAKSTSFDIPDLVSAAAAQPAEPDQRVEPAKSNPYQGISISQALAGEPVAQTLAFEMEAAPESSLGAAPSPARRPPAKPSPAHAPRSGQADGPGAASPPQAPQAMPHPRRTAPREISSSVDGATEGRRSPSAWKAYQRTLAARAKGSDPMDQMPPVTQTGTRPNTAPNGTDRPERGERMQSAVRPAAGPTAPEAKPAKPDGTLAAPQNPQTAAPRLDRGAQGSKANASGVGRPSTPPNAPRPQGDPNRATASSAPKRPAKGQIPDNLKMLDEDGQSASATMRDATAINAAIQQQAEANKAAEPKKTVSQVLGEIAWLMSQSPEHKHYSLADLEWLIMPPVMLEQFRIYYHNNMPVACALWAYVTPETEEKLKSGVKRLRPEEWCGGAANFSNKPLDQKEAATARILDVIAIGAVPKEKITSDLRESLDQVRWK